MSFRAWLAGPIIALMVVAGCTSTSSSGPAVDELSSSPTVAGTTSLLGTVIVRLSTIGHAPGDRVAGVLFRGRSSQALRDTRAVGGFGVATGPSPLTVTRTIKRKTALGAGDAFPYVDDVPVRLSQGWYTLLVWRGPTLDPYSRWFPAAEPGLAVCQVPVYVVAGSPTTIEVTAMPRQPRELMVDALPRCEGR